MMTREEIIMDCVCPENELEEFIISSPEWIEGVFWGKPRNGHPEGNVIYHIKEVLSNVDKYYSTDEERDKLRLISIIHDALKHKEAEHNWRINHGLLARQFAEPLGLDDRTLDIIELHDEIYYIWKTKFLSENEERATLRMERFMERMESNLDLYYKFYVCDTLTGDKTKDPLIWVQDLYTNELKISIDKI